jgi:hypothetical protein
VNGASRGGGKGRQVVGVVAALAALLVMGVIGFLLSGPTVSAVRDVTGGRWGADVTVGVLLLVLPVAVMIGYAPLARRRHWPRWPAWCLLVLYVPAFELEPFGRNGTNTALDQQVNTQLPGLLGGMLAGVGALVACLAVLYLYAVWRRKRAHEPIH